MEKKWMKPSKEQTRFDLLYMDLAELDKDISELVKLISIRGDGYRIHQNIFDDYSKVLKKLDDLSALNIKKSRHEDLIDCFSDMEDVYFDLEEIDDKCMKEPTVIIEEPDVIIEEKTEEVIEEPDVIIKEKTEEVIEIKEKN